MKGTFLVYSLVFSLIFVFAGISAAEFYVIPVKKQNFAPVEMTGQTKCWNESFYEIDCSGTGQDGEYQMGTAWPNPRFTDNGDGTVTDNLTNIVWMKQADCFDSKDWPGTLSDCNELTTSSCGLTDGSGAGDWRLPNVKQLLSLLHYGFQAPSLPNTIGTGQGSEGDPFIGVQGQYFFSSTSHAGSINAAWSVRISTGFTEIRLKSSSGWAWCVRDKH